MANRFTLPLSQDLDGSGDPYAGGKLYFYETGTSTPLDTYSDSTLSTANANPVVADGNGRFDDIFMKTQDYKVVLKTSTDVTIWTADPVSGTATATETKGADIASAAETDIGGSSGQYVEVTGTVTITSLGTSDAGVRRIVRFKGILTLTYNATSLILPGDANITTTADDCATFISLGSGNWVCVDYQRGSGVADTSAGKHHIWVPAAAMRPTSSNGCASITDVETTAGRPDLQVLDFDATADEHAQFGILMPKSWDEGTVTFQAVWTSTATDTNGVAWGLQGVAVSDDGTVDVAYGTAVVVTDDNISAAEDALITAESSAITIGGTPAEGDMVFFRVFRDVSDANDDMTEDARLIGIVLFLTTNAGNDD